MARYLVYVPLTSITDSVDSFLGYDFMWVVITGREQCWSQDDFCAGVVRHTWFWIDWSEKTYVHEPIYCDSSHSVHNCMSSGERCKSMCVVRHTCYPACPKLVEKCYFLSFIPTNLKMRRTCLRTGFTHLFLRLITFVLAFLLVSSGNTQVNEK